MFAKLLLISTVVISAVLLIFGYLLITFSHEGTISREKERAVNQFNFDSFTVLAGLISGAENEEPLNDTLTRISFGISGAVLFFSEDGTQIFSDTAANISLTQGTRDNLRVVQIQETYITVSGGIAHGGTTLYVLIATDISGILARNEQMTRNFMQIYFATLAIGMAGIFLLSWFMHERAENARRKEEFIANFTHELKTPLTSIIGYADMIYQKSLSPEQTKESALYILNEGLRLESLSLKLMDLFVMNRQNFVLEEVNAAEIFKDISYSMKPVLAEKNVSLYINIQPVVIRVECDLFKTLMFNLMDNAIKAGCKKINICGKISAGAYAVTVSDDGSGIPASELSKITEAFYTVDKSRSRRQHGAGIGLALAAKIAEIHGGTLVFNSAEGKGTDVKFNLGVA